MIDGEAARDCTAHRMPHDHRPPDIESVHKGRQIRSEIADRVPGGRASRVPVASLRRSEDEPVLTR